MDVIESHRAVIENPQRVVVTYADGDKTMQFDNRVTQVLVEDEMPHE